MGDEQINDAVGGAAHCEEPSIVGMLTTDVLEACTCDIVPICSHLFPVLSANQSFLQAAFADRIYGNPRIAQKIRHSPALQRAVL
jgi:hypothetical protein